MTAVTNKHHSFIMQYFSLLYIPPQSLKCSTIEEMSSDKN